MLIDEAQIQKLIPHTGNMCLLDVVKSWNMDSIHCVTDTHRNPDNPLRHQGQLAALHAFEYGAQAAAIHGGLCAEKQGQIAPAGYLAALHEAQWFITDLDKITASLEVIAQQLLNDAGYCIYTIQVSADEQVLAKARITIAPQPKGCS